MHRRIYPLAPLVLLALVAVLAAPASAAQLGKPAARKAAVKTMNRYLASHGWAKAGRVGKCQRKAPRRVVCRITLSGPSRACRTSAAVTLRRKARARLGRLRCAKPAPQRGSRMMRLAAHIGTPKRHLDNPFAVTYPYSASATEQVAARGGETEEPVPPPKGVLALYIDGVLECAMNTEGVVAGDECPHVYGKLGQHRVTAIYTAGSESAVDTTLHNVEPLPTSTTLSVTFTPLEGGPVCAGGDESYKCLAGLLHVTPGASPAGTAIVGCQVTDPAGCVDLEPGDTFAAAMEFQVRITDARYGLCDGTPAWQVSLVNHENATLGPPVGGGTGTDFSDLAAHFSSGASYVKARTSAPAGYLASEASAPIQFDLVEPPDPCGT